MNRELNDKDLEKASGGEGGIITRDTVEKLGLTVHDSDYCCDSFVQTPRDAGKNQYFSLDCSDCMYSAYVIEPEGGFGPNMACLLGK